MELLRGPVWRLVRKGRNPTAHKMSRGLSRRRLLRLGAHVCFLVHPNAREFSRSIVRSAGRTPQPTNELTQQGTIFLWISDRNRIISREGKLERRAYFIDGEELNWRRWEAGETVLVFSRSGSCWLVRPLNIYRWDLIQRFEDGVAQWRGRG